MEWIKGSKKWSDYPIGTKAKALMGGYWEKTDRGWKWCSGSTFPTPGGDATGEVCLPKPTEQTNNELAPYYAAIPQQ